MLSQFFSHYLLENNLVTREQLLDAIAHKSGTNVKLGVLAINAGFMTAEQVEAVHRQQERVDKRIGDIAVDLGFLTVKQINELLSAQKPTHLLLGQALVDAGVLSNAQFESAMKAYKAKFALDDGDFADEKDAKLATVVATYLNAVNTKAAAYPVDYIMLLFKALTRFITDDYTPLAASACLEGEAVYVTQAIRGDFAACTRIECALPTLTALAALFAKEDVADIAEYTEDAASEFLNQLNGLFAVNMSTTRSLELTLEPQSVLHSAEGLCGADVVVPVCFPFGVVRFVLKAA